MASGSPDRTIWIDGEWVAWDAAQVHILSHSHQRGSLVFDYMSVQETAAGTAIFRLQDHVQRFLDSCRLIGLPQGFDAATIRRAVCDTVVANPGAKAVKVFAYLPAVEVDVVPLDTHVALAISAYDPIRDVIGGKPNSPRTGPELSIRVESVIRNRRADLIPAQAKVAANYVAPMMAKWRAQREGFDEVVLLDESGHLAEGPTTNFFLVDPDGVVCTPSLDHVLPGITRASVIELAKHDGFPVREGTLLPEDLDAAAEVFLTGTSAGVWPVVCVDGGNVGDGTVGPITLALKNHFRQVVRGEDPAFSHWLFPVAADRGGAS